MNMGIGKAGIAGIPDQSQHLSSRHPDSGLDAPGNGGKMGTIVAQSVITNKAHRQAACRGTIIGRWIPLVDGRNLVNCSAGYRNIFCPAWGKDICRRESVTAFGETGSGRRLYGEDISE